MDKKKQEMIMAIAKEYGFDTFERIPDWKGYEVYSPYNKNGKMPFIGQPVFVLVKMGKHGSQPKKNGGNSSKTCRIDSSLPFLCRSRHIMRISP